MPERETKKGRFIEIDYLGELTFISLFILFLQAILVKNLKNLNLNVKQKSKSKLNFENLDFI